jgi:hypothetical protein
MAATDYPGFEAGDDTVIWRYMALPRYEELLAGRLYFAAARQFDDRFEGAVTQAQSEWRREEAARWADNDAERDRALASTSWAFAELRRLTKISCWHARSHENAAMWERYRREGTSTVAVRSTVAALKSSMKPFRLQPRYGEERIRIGAVQYLDYAREEMADRSMLGVFLHKRVEYSDESEVRALLALTMAEEFGVAVPELGVTVTVLPELLVHEVRVDALANGADFERTVSHTRMAGLSCDVIRSSLGAEPVY